VTIFALADVFATRIVPEPPCLKKGYERHGSVALATRIDNETAYINMAQADFDA